MNFQEYVDKFETMTCILSVERLENGGYGEIRIVTGNKLYIDSIERPNFKGAAAINQGKFIPDSLYEKYIPKDLNFENFCYNSAILKKVMHTCVHPERFPIWINMVLLPIKKDENDTNPNVEYCTYSQEFFYNENSDTMSSLSAETAASVLRTCIKLRSSKDMRVTMNEIVHDIRELCDANYCCTLLVDKQNRSCSVLAESILEGADEQPMENYIDEDFYNIVESWEDSIAGSSCLIIQNQHDMDVLRERNPNWYASLTGAGVKSLVLFPLKHNDEPEGYIWALNFNTDNTLRIKETLELTTYFIASEIANYQLLNKLEMLSSVDLLTGIYNRNAMNNRVSRLTSGKESLPDSLGIIFADLNGLKQKNDEEGHVAGDKMLKKAALILKDSFPECDIYRAGGDEFMVIAVDVDEELLKKRVEILRLASEDPDNISFALGLFYDRSGMDIRQAMRFADEKMYEDKRRYYKKFPERQRQ